MVEPIAVFGSVGASPDQIGVTRSITEQSFVFSSVGAVGPLKPTPAQSDVCLRQDYLCASRGICPQRPN